MVEPDPAREPIECPPPPPARGRVMAAHFALSLNYAANMIVIPRSGRLEQRGALWLEMDPHLSPADQSVSRRCGGVSKPRCRPLGIFHPRDKSPHPAQGRQGRFNRRQGTKTSMDPSRVCQGATSREAGGEVYVCLNVSDFFLGGGGKSERTFVRFLTGGFASIPPPYRRRRPG